MTEHLLEITIDDGCARTKLICPKEGCVGSMTCGQCGREIDDDETPRCYDCPTKPADCWLASWAEDEDLSAFMEDQPVGTFTIDAGWDGDGPVITVRPSSSLSLSEIDRLLKRASRWHPADQDIAETLRAMRDELTKENDDG